MGDGGLRRDLAESILFVGFVVVLFFAPLPLASTFLTRASFARGADVLVCGRCRFIGIGGGCSMRRF